MDSYFFTFLCILIMQMSIILVFLNPDNDVRKITLHMNNIFTKHRTYCIISIGIYFIIVLYLGMYTPLIGVLKLISNNKYNENEKRIIVSNVEKIYIMAGFSIFLFIVSRGVRALTVYAAKLVDSIYLRNSNDYRGKRKQGYVTDTTKILSSLLRIKRPIAKNEPVFEEGIKEQLMNILKETRLPDNNKFSAASLEIEPSM